MDTTHDELARVQKRFRDQHQWRRDELLREADELDEQAARLLTASEDSTLGARLKRAEAELWVLDGKDA